MLSSKWRERKQCYIRWRKRERLWELKTRFHQVGYVPSQACAVSQSDSSRLISPHRGTVNPPLLIWLNHDSHLNSAEDRKEYPSSPPCWTTGGECKKRRSFCYLTQASSSHKCPLGGGMWKICFICLSLCIYIKKYEYCVYVMSS